LLWHIHTKFGSAYLLYMINVDLLYYIGIIILSLGVSECRSVAQRTAIPVPRHKRCSYVIYYLYLQYKYTWKPNLPEDECAVPPWWCDPLLKFNCLENRAGKMLCGWCGSPPDTPFRSIAVPVTVRRVAKRRRCSARVQARGSGDGSDAVVATGVLMRMHCVTWRHGRNFYWNCYYMYYIDTRLYIYSGGCRFVNKRIKIQKQRVIYLLFYGQL